MHTPVERTRASAQTSHALHDMVAELRFVRSAASSEDPLSLPKRKLRKKVFGTAASQMAQAHATVQARKSTRVIGNRSFPEESQTRSLGWSLKITTSFASTLMLRHEKVSTQVALHTRRDIVWRTRVGSRTNALAHGKERDLERIGDVCEVTRAVAQPGRRSV